MSESNQENVPTEPAVNSSLGIAKEKLSLSWKFMQQALFDRIEHALAFLVVLLAIILLYSANPWVERERHISEIALSQLDQHMSGAHIFATSYNNQHYLKESGKQAMDDILLLTELTVVLDVVASSQIGVSFIADFNVTVGQGLNDFNQLVKKALMVNLASVAATELIAIILKLSDWLAPMLLKITLFIWLFYFFLCLVNPSAGVPRVVLFRSRLIARELSILFLVFHLLLPYSVHGAAFISKNLKTDVIDDSNHLSAIHRTLVPKRSAHKLKHRATASIDHLKKISPRQLKDKNQSLLVYTLRATVRSFFNLIVMPLGILFGLLQIAKRIVREAEMGFDSVPLNTK